MLPSLVHHASSRPYFVFPAKNTPPADLDAALLGAPRLVLHALEQRGQHQLHALACIDQVPGSTKKWLDT